MRRALPWIGAAAAGVVALASVGALVAAAGTMGNAADARDGAARLLAARRAVAAGSEALGDSDLDDAVAAARSANATALRVGHYTQEIIDLLTPTADAAAATLELSRRGGRGAVTARRQTEVAGDVLGAIAGYQEAASRYSVMTNAALRRILTALKKTNRSFPGE